MAKREITHTPNRWQALFWLVLLLSAPFLFYFRQKIEANFYHETQCAEPRRRQWRSYEAPIPPGYAVHGIDVSHYSCDIDWQAVKQMNQNGIRVQFAFMRATRGSELLDYQFQNNWEGAKEVGILRGAYHFYQFADGAAEQAKFFLRHVAIYAGDLPPVLDIENDKASRDEDLDRDKILRGIALWLKMVEEETGVRPLIYTNQDYYKRYIAGNFPGYPIWIASYKNLKGVNLPDGRAWSFWQFSEKGRCHGISEYMDLNVFAGSYEQLTALCKK
jgi:lysozyme